MLLYSTAKIHRSNHLLYNKSVYYILLTWMMVCASLFCNNYLFIKIEHCGLMAIRCLCLLFVSTKTKKMGNDIPFIMKVVPVSS